MKAAFAGSFAVRLIEPVRTRLTIPCEIVSGDEAGILDQLGDADVLVSMAFTKEMAAAGNGLRLVQVPGAGLDRIDRSQLRAGLALANAYGHEAELMFVGGPERLDDLLSGSDYLAITLSLSAETRDLIDARRLGLMKPSAYLINVARAEIVDEKALYNALASGRLAGAVLDVWYHYPTSAGSTAPAAAPFHQLSNVIMTPHVSGWTEGMFEARAGVIAENIARTARGEKPVNAIAFAD